MTPVSSSRWLLCPAAWTGSSSCPRASAPSPVSPTCPSPRSPWRGPASPSHRPTTQSAPKWCCGARRAPPACRRRRRCRSISSAPPTSSTNWWGCSSRSPPNWPPSAAAAAAAKGKEARLAKPHIAPTARVRNDTSDTECHRTCHNMFHSASGYMRVPFYRDLLMINCHCSAHMSLHILIHKDI